jgi:hypothetical protein
MSAIADLDAVALRGPLRGHLRVTGMRVWIPDQLIYAIIADRAK